MTDKNLPQHFVQEAEWLTHLGIKSSQSQRISFKAVLIDKRHAYPYKHQFTLSLFSFSITKFYKKISHIKTL